MKMNVLARKHEKNGGFEFVKFETDLDGVSMNEREALLARLCKKPWGHCDEDFGTGIDAASALVDYLNQSPTVQMMTMGVGCERIMSASTGSVIDTADIGGIVIDFYESMPGSPKHYGTPGGPEFVTSETLDEEAEIARNLALARGYSVRGHTKAANISLVRAKSVRRAKAKSAKKARRKNRK